MNNVELAAQVQQQIRTYQNLADQLDLMANNDRLRRANIKAALDTVNINRNQVLTEGQMLDLIQRQARDTESRKAIMQIGNDLALTQVHQARRMENLLQTQIVMQANFQAAEQSKETREQAESDDAWERVREGRKRLQQQYQERARNQP